MCGRLRQVILDLAGAGALDLVDSDGLIFNAVTTGGNASFATTGADLVLTAASIVSGDLALSTVDSGNIVIPDSGLSHGGGLAIDAESVRDSDGHLNLTAPRLIANLRDQRAASSWSTTFSRLGFTLAGGGAFELANTGALNVFNLVSVHARKYIDAGELVVFAKPLENGEWVYLFLNRGDMAKLTGVMSLNAASIYAACGAV